MRITGFIYDLYHDKYIEVPLILQVVSEEDDTLDLTMLLPSFSHMVAQKEFPCWVLESRLRV